MLLAVCACNLFYIDVVFGRAVKVVEVVAAVCFLEINVNSLCEGCGGSKIIGLRHSAREVVNLIALVALNHSELVSGVCLWSFYNACVCVAAGVIIGIGVRIRLFISACAVACTITCTVTSAVLNARKLTEDLIECFTACEHHHQRKEQSNDSQKSFCVLHSLISYFFI